MVFKEVSENGNDKSAPKLLIPGFSPPLAPSVSGSTGKGALTKHGKRLASHKVEHGDFVA